MPENGYLSVNVIYNRDEYGAAEYESSFLYNNGKVFRDIKQKITI